MIMLSGKNSVDTSLYDHVWYVTTTCPGMRTGCEHHPELAVSLNTHLAISRGLITPEKFIEQYLAELKSEPKASYLRELVERSEAGEWFQLVFYEDDPDAGERPYMYSLLKGMTDNVYIE